MKLGKKQSKKRNEEIFCPKCKNRGYREFSLKKEDVVRFYCKHCGHKWTQNTILGFVEEKEDIPFDRCECGGKFSFNRFSGRLLEIWKCNKCGAENTPEAM